MYASNSPIPRAVRRDAAIHCHRYNSNKWLHPRIATVTPQMNIVVMRHSNRMSTKLKKIFALAAMVWKCHTLYYPGSSFFNNGGGRKEIGRRRWCQASLIPSHGQAAKPTCSALHRRTEHQYERMGSITVDQEAPWTGLHRLYLISGRACLPCSDRIRLSIMTLEIQARRKAHTKATSYGHVHAFIYYTIKYLTTTMFG